MEVAHHDRTILSRKLQRINGALYGCTDSLLGSFRSSKEVAEVATDRACRNLLLRGLRAAACAAALAFAAWVAFLLWRVMLH